MILQRISRNARAYLLNFPCYTFISHKFYYGQGGDLQMNLTKRAYDIQIETIWEDYCEL